MKTYIALLKSINVGGKNLLPMKELVALLEENSFLNIKTYIQSGNVIFQSKVKPQAVGELIANKFGFKPEVFILEKSELDAAIKRNPYSPAEGKLVHFYFCNKTPTLNMDRLKALAAKSEQYFLKGKVFYLHAPNGVSRSKLVANIESCLGMPATGRNLNTVNKLKEMAANLAAQ
ncbi:MAG: hypothetical protein JWM78_2531 [Verrucomicrobiaceae bacterium]|nr:hypothetical protein [Verrucomicrobiaceae bacterium]